MGFEEASPIQEKAIPLLLAGHDLIGQAETGTGKTAAFAIPSIENLLLNNSAVQTLVLCPTRELVMQVAEEFKKLCSKQKGIYILPVYGGQSITVQLKSLRKGVQIVIGTPGRIMDHMRRGSLKLKDIKTVVLDEADQMLDMGFREDIDLILKATPKERQTVMFSATMPKELVRLMEKHLNNPKRVSTMNPDKQSKQIKQLCFTVAKNTAKLKALKFVLEQYQIQSALIFCNTKIKVDELADELNQEDFSSAALHGDIRQNKRTKTMNAFKQGKIQFLVATDVAARGIDVGGLEAVINYDIPRFDQDYVHRIGRTGRAGKTGLAISLITPRENEHIKYIARKNKMKIEFSKF